MAEIFILVGIVVLIFLGFLVFTFFSYTSLFVNILLIGTLLYLIKKDLKKGNGKYYIASMFLTALCFIFSASGIGKELLLISERLMLSYVTLALALIYILGNAVAFLYEFAIHKFFPHSKEKYLHGKH